jgi:hypothetical protein
VREELVVGPAFLAVSGEHVRVVEEAVFLSEVDEQLSRDRGLEVDERPR